MNEEDMIKRVARAICCPDGCDGDTGSGRPCDIEREDRTSMQQARAAIGAMRELTSAMLDAVDGPWCDDDRPSFEREWKMAIDAALARS
jgi:hypothetical protein